MKKIRMLFSFLSLLFIMSLCSCGSMPNSGGIVTESPPPDQFNDTSFSMSTEDRDAYTAIVRSQPADGNKRIYRGDLTLETTQFEEAQAALDALVAELGGYYQERNISGVGSGYQDGRYVVRVPTEQFDKFCKRTGEVCHLLSANTTAEDISEAYYDTESRLETQKTKLDRLQALLAKSTSMEDIIALESAISDTVQSMEGLTGSLRGYDSLIQFSTVTITLQEVYQLSSETPRADGFGNRMGTALADGLRSAGRGLEGFLLGMASHWVALVVLVMIVVIGCRVWHKRRPILKANSPQEKVEPPQPPETP